MDENIFTIYCDGPPDKEGNATHERYVVAQYARRIINSDDGRPPVRTWEQLDEWEYGGRRKRARNFGGEHFLVDETRREGVPSGDAEKWQRTLNWECPRCGLDEQRTHVKSAVTSKLWQAFEGLTAAGKAEASARSLIAIFRATP